MPKKIIYNLHQLDVNVFLYEILPAQSETVVGGNTVVDLSTIHDGINNISTTFPSLIGVENNKLFSVDLSRLTMNLVIVLSDGESRLFRWLT